VEPGVVFGCFFSTGVYFRNGHREFEQCMLGKHGRVNPFVIHDVYQQRVDVVAELLNSEISILITKVLLQQQVIHVKLDSLANGLPYERNLRRS